MEKKNNETYNYNVLQSVSQASLYAWIPRLGGSKSNYGYVVGASSNKYEAVSTGGYIKSSTSLGDYSQWGVKIFQDGKKGILLKYNAAMYGNGIGADNTINVQALPDEFINTGDKFNKQIKNN